MSTTESAPVPEMDHVPVTIVQSRRKPAADAICFVLLGALSASQYDANMAHRQGWSAILVPIDLFAVVLFGLCTVGCVIEMLRPPRLVVDVQGITQKSLFRSHTIPWREIDNFRACRLVSFWPSDRVKFDYLQPRAVHPIRRAIIRISGDGTTLGPGWAMKAERLAALLSAARNHWAGSPQTG